MILTSVGVGAAARAADPACCMDAVPGAAAADQDSCLTPSDCDKDCPHPGACHGHQVATMADAGMVLRPRRVSVVPADTLVFPLVAVDLESTLRPPRA